MRRRMWTLRVVLGVGAVAGMLAAVAVTGASVSPATKTFTLRAGDPALGVGTETKTVGVPAVPPRADIEIAIDTTGSMGPSIAQAKADATAVVTGVQALVPDTQFAVVQFRDAGDSPDYQVVQPMTATAADVQTAINGLSAGGGGDAPEAYSRVFHESYTPLTGGAIGWRANTRKFVVVIGDAQPHGAGSAGFAGCTDATADPFGFNSATEIAGMNGAERTLFMIRQVSPNTTASLACYDSLAAGAFPTGDAVDAGGSLAAQIVALINAAFANVSDVHLEVASAGPAPASASWISFSPPAVGPVPAPSTQAFTLTATVPGGTPAGTYLFDIVALADGVDIGHQALTIVVPVKQISLVPPTASNPIGTTHTVTATVFDTLGPFVGDTVSFSVVSGPDAGDSGAGVTGGSGQATFTVTNAPPAPGTDTITASVASNDGPVSASATKVWVNAPPDCSGVVLDVTSLWPPNHKLRPVTASGATDSDVGDSATLVVDGVTQDEPVDAIGNGDGNTAPDAFLTSPLSDLVWIRAERAGGGDGRVYRVHFTATDTHGATCDGTAVVSVPHDRRPGAVAVDSAPPSFDSLLP